MSVETVAMFKGLVFEPAALLRHLVWLGGDEPHDLMVLAHYVRDTLAERVTVGVAEELG